MTRCGGEPGMICGKTSLPRPQPTQHHRQLICRHLQRAESPGVTGRHGRQVASAHSLKKRLQFWVGVEGVQLVDVVELVSKYGIPAGALAWKKDGGVDQTDALEIAEQE